MSFSALGLTPSLSLPLARLGYDEPTLIQTLAIPAVLTGRDLLARAQTGTGKTAAFGLPMIERLLVRFPELMEDPRADADLQTRIEACVTQGANGVENR